MNIRTCISKLAKLEILCIIGDPLNTKKREVCLKKCFNECHCDKNLELWYTCSKVKENITFELNYHVLNK